MQNFIIKSFFVTLLCFTLGAAKAQFTTSSEFARGWYFPLPDPTDPSPTLYRNGSYCLRPQAFDIRSNEVLRNRGFMFFNTNIDMFDRFKAYGYGLFLADFDRTNISKFNNNNYSWNTMALMLRGFGGLALLSQEGGMYVHQNGIVSVGLNPEFEQTAIRSLSEKEVQLGYSLTGYQLYVRQGIVSEKVKVANIANWPDYVFQKDYQLLPLSKVEAHIKEKGHLPNVPAAAVIEKEGVELGDMTKRQQEKIEELFLHLIALEKRVQALEAENAALKQPISTTNK